MSVHSRPDAEDQDSATPASPARSQDADRNRDGAQRPGSPPTSAYVPVGAEETTHSEKTRTDPDTGAPVEGDQEPAASKTDRDV